MTKISQEVVGCHLNRKRKYTRIFSYLSFVQDFFLLPMGTLPRSKTKSRKSRNREVRRVLITYVSVFFRSDYSICSSGIVQWIFFLQAVTRPYLFFLRKTFLCETEVFCPSSIRLFFFFLVKLFNICHFVYEYIMQFVV